MRLNLKQWTLLGLSLLLAACSNYERFPGQNKIVADKAERQAQAEKQMPAAAVSMQCVPHGDYIYSFYVQEPLSKRMHGGPCAGRLAVGYSLPRTWQPGMKVKVRWNRPIKGEDNWIEKYTTIRPYEKAGTLYVHFFDNDEVRVVASAFDTPRSPNHPIPRDLVVPPAEIK